MSVGRCLGRDGEILNADEAAKAKPLNPLEVAAGAYRKAQLEFEAADATHKLLADRYREGWERVTAAHPELLEISSRCSAASSARRDAGEALKLAQWALQDAAKVSP